MAEEPVPNVGGGGGGGESSAPWLVIAEERVEVAGASGDHDDPPGSKILHNKAIGGKFNRAQVIFGELAN